MPGALLGRTARLPGFARRDSFLERLRRFRYALKRDERTLPAIRKHAAVIVSLFLVATAACSSNTRRQSADTARVAVARNPHSGLSAVVTVETERPERVVLTATSTDGGTHVVTTPITNAAEKRHAIPLLGMRAQRHYNIDVALTNRSGAVQKIANAATFVTDPLPSNLPRFDVTSVPARMSGGFILFNLTYSPPAGEKVTPPAASEYGKPTSTRKDAGWIVGVDQQGQVVWYYSAIQAFTDVSPTNHGTLLVDVQDVAIREIDMLGDTQHEWDSRFTKDPGSDLVGRRLGSDDAQSLDTDSAHHDAQELPNGNLITLSTELIQLPADVGAKLCPTSPARTIAADVVVEFTRSGKIVHRWPIAQALDPAQNPGAHMCEVAVAVAPPATFYPSVRDLRDWTHANAVVVDEKTNTLIVSLRHLDAVVGLRYETDAHGPAGKLLWNFGPHGDFKLEGGGQWQYHQHAPELHDDGTILLYDNGNLRPGTGTTPGAAPPYSRAVEYQVDVANKTARQLWEHRDKDPWGTTTYAPFVGDADLTAAGTVLITHGGRSDNQGRLAGRIVETTQGKNGAPDQVVFDLTPVHQDGEGWMMYRAEKLPSLYLGPTASG
jgi:arylsulfate sulfotransferase